MRASIDKPGRTIVAPCRIDIEQTNDSLHAHVEIEGVHVGPGDRVVVVDAPGLVAFGEQRDFVRVARITRDPPAAPDGAHRGLSRADRTLRSRLFRGEGLMRIEGGFSTSATKQGRTRKRF